MGRCLQSAPALVTVLTAISIVGLSAGVQATEVGNMASLHAVSRAESHGTNKPAGTAGDTQTKHSQSLPSWLDGEWTVKSINSGGLGGEWRWVVKLNSRKLEIDGKSATTPVFTGDYLSFDYGRPGSPVCRYVLAVRSDACLSGTWNTIDTKGQVLSGDWGSTWLQKADWGCKEGWGWGSPMQLEELNAQWKHQECGSLSYLGVFFIDNNTGTIVGSSGAIIRTSDGGATWRSQKSGAKVNLWDVCFWDENSGTAVGDDGCIVQTVNGGAMWMKRMQVTRSPLHGVGHVNARTVVVVGENGVILRTADGGASWGRLKSGVDVSLNDVSFASEAIGTVVGNEGTILRTTDGGETWEKQLSGTDSSLMGVHFSDPDTGTAVGMGGAILHTINGGTSWVWQASGVKTALMDVSFADALTGRAVGDGGTIIQTTDGGATWTGSSSATGESLLGVFITSRGLGVAVGLNGAVLHESRDQGR
ncbi:MAG: hypothetical protein EHM80_11505, partial [Nitrospiraceae bacterium]